MHLCPRLSLPLGSRMLRHVLVAAAAILVLASAIEARAEPEIDFSSGHTASSLDVKCDVLELRSARTTVYPVTVGGATDGWIGKCQGTLRLRLWPDDLLQALPDSVRAWCEPSVEAVLVRSFRGKLGAGLRMAGTEESSALPPGPMRDELSRFLLLARNEFGWRAGEEHPAVCTPEGYGAIFFLCADGRILLHRSGPGGWALSCIDDGAVWAAGTAAVAGPGNEPASRSVRVVFDPVAVRLEAHLRLEPKEAGRELRFRVHRSLKVLGASRSGKPVALRDVTAAGLSEGGGLLRTFETDAGDGPLDVALSWQRDEDPPLLADDFYVTADALRVPLLWFGAEDGDPVRFEFRRPARFAALLLGSGARLAALAGQPI